MKEFEALGVSRDRITAEEHSRNTIENAVFSRSLANPKPGEPSENTLLNSSPAGNGEKTRPLGVEFDRRERRRPESVRYESGSTKGPGGSVWGCGPGDSVPFTGTASRLKHN